MDNLLQDNLLQDDLPQDSPPQVAEEEAGELVSLALGDGQDLNEKKLLDKDADEQPPPDSKGVQEPLCRVV